MKRAATLADRRHDLTRQLILDSAIGMLEKESVSTLTVRAVAKHANISERTVFRYFATRDEFLDAIADEVRTRMELPAPPTSLAELEAAPRLLYTAFEARASLVKAALHSELFPRMRETQAKMRWMAVARIVDGLMPKRPERERKIAAANIRYFLSASTWHYYRASFGFSLEDSIACAETAIRQALKV